MISSVFNKCGGLSDSIYSQLSECTLRLIRQVIQVYTMAWYTMAGVLFYCFATISRMANDSDVIFPLKVGHFGLYKESTRVSVAHA